MLAGCDADPRPVAAPPIAATTTPVVNPADRPLRPCYDSPIQTNLLRDIEQSPLPPLVLREQSKGKVLGDPGPLKPEIKKKLAGATVKVFNVIPIRNVILRGTGFLLEPDLVVAAAHSAATNSLGTVEITDSNGNLSDVIDGCYIYEKNDKQVNPLEITEGASVDVAVLRLGRPLGSATLSLANTPLVRGEWATFYNYQGGRKVNNPANYNGVTLADRADVTGNVLLTGIQGWRGCEPVKDRSSDCSIEPGASGGPVVRWDTDEVVGSSVRGTKDARLDDQAMRTYGAVPTFNVGINTGYLPRIAFTSDARAIQAAVDAMQ